MGGIRCTSRAGATSTSRFFEYVGGKGCYKSSGKVCRSAVIVRRTTGPYVSPDAHFVVRIPHPACGFVHLGPCSLRGYNITKQFNDFINFLKVLSIFSPI